MAQNSSDIKAFILENSNLFWYIPENEKENISKELLIETIFNYGDMDAFLKMLNIIGRKEVARIFFALQGRKKLNYFPEIYNFFYLYLRTYA